MHVAAPRIRSRHFVCRFDLGTMDSRGVSAGDVCSGANGCDRKIRTLIDELVAGSRASEFILAAFAEISSTVSTRRMFRR